MWIAGLYRPQQIVNGNVSVVMEIPLHFFVTPFSFFQMELEAEALHGP